MTECSSRGEKNMVAPLLTFISQANKTHVGMFSMDIFHALILVMSQKGTFNFIFTWEEKTVNLFSGI